MGRRKRGGVNATGRSTNATSRFTRLDHALQREPAYSALTVASRALLVELAMLENGKNNGALWLSVADAAARIGVADRRVVMASFDQLEALGFIVMTRGASFSVKTSAKGPRARCWRLTWLIALGRPATHEYKDKRPQDKSEIHRMDRRQLALKAYGYRLSSEKSAGEESALLDEVAASIGAENALLQSKKPSISVVARGAESSPYTADTMGSGGTWTLTRARWWQGKVLADLDAATWRSSEMAVAG